MARENAETKSRRYLSEHRLLVTTVNDDTIRAVCRGDGALYRLGWNGVDRWWCSCPAVSPSCAHLRALKAVTIRANTKETQR
jgi:hypothetical protein